MDILIPSDEGGVFTLFVTIIIFAVFLYWSGILSRIRKHREIPLREFTGIILLGVAFVALWISVRLGGLTLYRFLYEEGFNYTLNDVFDLLSYILTINLCFTLIGVFIPEITSETRSRERTHPRKITPTGELVDVAIQAVVIGLITFIPKNKPELLEGIIGPVEYLFILIGLIVSIVSLGFAKKYLFSTEVVDFSSLVESPFARTLIDLATNEDIRLERSDTCFPPEDGLEVESTYSLEMFIERLGAIEKKPVTVFYNRKEKAIWFNEGDQVLLWIGHARSEYE